MNRIEQLIVAVLLVFPFQVMAQDNEDLFIYKTETCIDIDTLSYLCEKAKKDLAHMEEVRQRNQADIHAMLSQCKASTEQQQELLRQAFSLYVNRGGGIEQKTSIGLTALGAALGSNKRITYTSSKKLDKVRKAVEKRKVHEELRPILQEMLTISPEEERIEDQVSHLSEALKTLLQAQSDREKTDAEHQLKYYIETGYYKLIVQSVPLKIVRIPQGLRDRSQFYMTVDGKRIPNRNSWLWLWLNHYDKEWRPLLTANMTKGWEWANDKNKLVKKHEHYPYSVEFHMSPDHPEYAVIEGAIYDKNGKLLRVTECFTADYNSIKWDIVKRDYQANKYDIKSAPKKTQDYLMKTLGLSAPTAEDMKRYKKIGNEYKEAAVADMKQKFAVTKREKRDAKVNADRKGKKFATSFLNEVFSFDTEGDKFVRQICHDHRYDLQINYYVERIDELSFIVKYINCGNTGEIYTTKVWYTQDGKFAKKKHSELIGVEKMHIVVDDFIDPEIPQPMHGSLSDLRNRNSM